MRRGGRQRVTWLVQRGRERRLACLDCKTGLPGSVESKTVRQASCGEMRFLGLPRNDGLPSPFRPQNRIQRQERGGNDRHQIVGRSLRKD